MVQYTCYETPFCLMKIGSENGCIVFIGRCTAPDYTPCPSPVADRAAAQLTEYFSGTRKEFDLPLSPKGTPFQKAVWAALTRIPYGEKRSYRDIAVAVGNEKACRAVGMAGNRNPIWIVILCHRG